MEVRVIGIDLGVKTPHTAAIFAPARQAFLVKQMRFRSREEDMMRVLERARRDVTAEVRLVVMLEATGMSWHPVGLFFHRHGATVYRINGRYTKAQQGELASCPQRPAG